MVIGPGRSGTSTIAGALAKSGYAVPGRSIGGNPTNPGGFFEPRWVVDLHRDLLRRAGVGTLDAAPHGVQRTTEVAERPEVRAKVRDWLGARLEEHPRLVVKDPRAVWFRDLWVDTAGRLDAEVAFVTMLRHPAEVSTSRRTYYSKAEAAAARAGSVRNVAGWVNVALLAEQQTQGFPRAFVRYVDLVADWRPVLAGLSDRLGLVLDPPPQARPHPVDDFVDPALHRLRRDWDDVEVPPGLLDLGERVWAALSRLPDRTGDQTGDQARDQAGDRSGDELEALRAEYALVFDDATAMAADEIRRRVRAARRQARRRTLPGPPAATGTPAAGSPSLQARLRDRAGRLARRLRRLRPAGEGS